jgi:hypothetical protein
MKQNPQGQKNGVIASVQKILAIDAVANKATQSDVGFHPKTRALLTFPEVSPRERIRNALDARIEQAVGRDRSSSTTG